MLKTSSLEMELPNIGKHCSLKSCNQLDFLPFKCSLCNDIFCGEHYKQDSHPCAGTKADARATVCPVCSQVIPVNRNSNPNLAVDAHIAKGCQPVTTTKAYTNSCSVPNCKVKSLVPIKCDACLKTHCIKHRLEADHSCTGSASRGSSAAGRAALSRYFLNNKERMIASRA